MDEKFKILIEDLHKKYAEMLAMRPVTVDTAPANSPEGGVYLFFENGVPLYAGRTKRRINVRLKNHVCSSPDCPFAWHLAREATGNKKATYQKEGSRKHLLSQSEFKAAYERAKDRIRKMDVRYIGESNPLKQALLEIYIAVVSGAKFNDFDTH